MSAPDIVERLVDLHKQATVERSHYYVGATVKAASIEILQLREALGWFLTDPRFQVAVGGNPNVVNRMLADARARLAN